LGGGAGRGRRRGDQGRSRSHDVVPCVDVGSPAFRRASPCRAAWRRNYEHAFRLKAGLRARDRPEGGTTSPRS